MNTDMLLWETQICESSSVQNRFYANSRSNEVLAQSKVPSCLRVMAKFQPITSLNNNLKFKLIHSFIYMVYGDGGHISFRIELLTWGGDEITVAWIVIDNKWCEW